MGNRAGGPGGGNTWAGWGLLGAAMIVPSDSILPFHPSYLFRVRVRFLGEKSRWCWLPRMCPGGWSGHRWCLGLSPRKQASPGPQGFLETTQHWWFINNSYKRVEGHVKALPVDCLLLLLVIPLTWVMGERPASLCLPFSLFYSGKGRSSLACLECRL